MPEPSIFYGTVHPIGDGLSFDEPIRIDFGQGEYLQLAIVGGRFQALSTLGGISEDPASFMNHLASVIQGCLDALGFHLGIGVTVEVDGGFISPNRTVLSIRHRWPEAAGREWSDPLRVEDDVLAPYTRAAIDSPLVRFALADLRLALRNAEDTGFYAYRACESVRQWFQRVEPPTEDPAVGWRRLRTTLSIEEADLKELAGFARARRHGDGAPITEQERLSCIGIARSVVARFVAHLDSSHASGGPAI